jgi:hypothetical protein
VATIGGAGSGARGCPKGLWQGGQTPSRLDSRSSIPGGTCNTRPPALRPAATLDGLKGGWLAPILTRVTGGQDGTRLRKAPSAGRLERGMREPKDTAAGAR